MEYISDAERAQVMGQEPYALAGNEIAQARQTGRRVDGLHERLATLEPHDHAPLMDLYEEARGAAPAGERAHVEASTLTEIRAQLPSVWQVRPPVDDTVEDRVRGAWYGRVAGNMLGKPVEKGWPRARLTSYLIECDAFPLTDYVPLDDDEPQHARALGFQTHVGLTRGRVGGGVRDDDIDYTIINLLVLERHRLGFTTEDVAREWLSRFPVYQLYTAERAAYQNLIRGVPLAEVGAFHNPYREWIGALIRADVFGYVAAGDPRAAAELAFKDAVLSHRSNGLYGEMWAAALIASAFVAHTPEESLAMSLEHVPEGSRLAEELRTVVADHDAGLRWEECMDRLDDRHRDLSWVHVLNNAGSLAAAILWGEGDFTATIALAVQAGLDTDSTGATAGSWAGAFVGFGGIPPHWVEPLEGRTTSAVFGCGDVRIDDLASRTSAFMTEQSPTGSQERRAAHASRPR